MSQGRCGSMLIVVALLSLVVHLEPVHGANFTVGDKGGWTFNVSGWPNGKSFKAGDILEFIYDRAHHDVIVVNQNDYNSCKTSLDSPAFQTGDDHIPLAKGHNYFISNFPGDCAAGVKIAVNATAPPPTRNLPPVHEPPANETPPNGAQPSEQRKRRNHLSQRRIPKTQSNSSYSILCPSISRQRKNPKLKRLPRSPSKL
ncbi:chemocyanin-like [Cornus florida]|uniref:chemocyanin-like n=1 Tax=Cornus florida TaxID=4283 RepID=UPI00289F690C|nr:chemocyanin-like [Cornus florida]